LSDLILYDVWRVVKSGLPDCAGGLFWVLRVSPQSPPSKGRNPGVRSVQSADGRTGDAKVDGMSETAFGRARRLLDEIRELWYNGVRKTSRSSS